MIKKSAVLNGLRSWLGVREPDHKFIIDIYNEFFDRIGHRPRGYRVTYYDAWCATGLSAAIIQALIAAGEDRYPFELPLECGCQEMIGLYEKLGQYHSRGSFDPQEGDIVFYDWQGDGHSDHVGMVEENNGGALVIIECNNDDAVKRRYTDVNNTNICGYARPNWESEVSPMIIPDIQLEDGQAIYRLYNPAGYHMFTASHDEAQGLANSGWEYEGMAWVAPKNGTGVFRFIKGAAHVFTSQEDEKTRLVENGYAEEGQAFFAKTDATFPYLPVYALRNPGNGDYLYTTKQCEFSSLCDAGWESLGIVFYALR